MQNRKLVTVLRCLSVALLVAGAFAFVPATAQAGAVCTPNFHGVSIFKSCVSPKNRCATDADCSDSDQCNGIEQCATEEAPGSNVVECTITLANPAIHCDNLTILDAADAILNATGPGATSDTLELSGDCTGVVSGTCTDGTDLGGATTCTIAPGGSCTFLANYYTTVPTDPSTLNDQATISVMDTCSGSPTGCSSTPNDVQFTASTDTVSGCSPGTPLDCDDGLFCTDDSCVPATGCEHATHDCSDTDQCTDDICNEDLDQCEHPLINPPLPGCVPNEEICRTPGFWGTHGGTEKSSSQQITGTVLDVFGGTLSICGVTIDSVDEALQAICVSPKGDSRLQLARQLTSAALNCGITNADDACTAQNGALPCNGTSVEDVFNACNTACTNDEVQATIGSDTFSCIAAIDCFNNGGSFDTSDGSCNCLNGFDENGECANSCHSQPLSSGCFDFVPPGAAGSPNACQQARKDCTTIFGSQCP